MDMGRVVTGMDWQIGDLCSSLMTTEAILNSKFIILNYYCCCSGGVV